MSECKEGLTPASVASGPPEASRCADGRSARQQQASLGRATRTLRRNGPSRNGTVMASTRVGRMLGAPWSSSAHARCGIGGAWRLQAPTPASIAAVSVGSDHLQCLQTVYDERFAREYGSWRPVVAQVADKFLACGVLDHGFARMRCNACMHEYLLAFSCKCRYFCPSCHAKRLAICWIPRCSRRCRTGGWCSPSPSGSAPTVSTVATCSARSA